MCVCHRWQMSSWTFGSVPTIVYIVCWFSLAVIAGWMVYSMEFHNVPCVSCGIGWLKAFTKQAGFESNCVICMLHPCFLQVLYFPCNINSSPSAESQEQPAAMPRALSGLPCQQLRRWGQDAGDENGHPSHEKYFCWRVNVFGLTLTGFLGIMN